MGKSKTKNQKKSRANAIHLAQEDFGTVPHSFVFHRGQIGKNVSQLIVDMRRVMEPYTAESLKVRKKNVLKDFAAVAGPLGVTHFLIFTKTENSVNLRLARLPRGPTLHFKVAQYSLIKDVVSSLKRHRMHDQQFTHHPLLVLNNFGVPGMHVKLMATMFQNMFPSINVHKVSLNAIKRCVMINYNPETQLIDFRHYSLKVVPVGMSKGIKKLLQEKFPNMSKFEDISELLMKGANLSESEAELDGDHNTTELPQVYAGRGNMKAQQSAVRLIEIGPRMTLQLIKIDEGMCEGNVLYHAIVEKTEAEIQEMLARKQKKLKLKAERKLNQERNVAVKKEQRDENKKRSLEGIKKKLPPKAGEEGDSDAEDPGKEEDQAAADHSEDDEVEYYRQAVGQEPDEERRQWHTGIVFVFNLAVCDLLYVLSLPLLIGYYANDKNWIFGDALCRIERFMFTCNLYGSIFFITCISLNRYVGIVHPFFTRSYVQPKHAKVVSLAVWFLVIGICSPVFHFSMTEKKGNKTQCLGSATDDKITEYIPYSLFLASFGCALPFLATFSSYFAILVVVWKNDNITNAEKRKIGVMIFTVIVLYVVSFIPYHVLRNVNLFNRDDSCSRPPSMTIYDGYQVSKVLVTLNMCIHPLLYVSVFDSMRAICGLTTSTEIKQTPSTNVMMKTAVDL
ncbi:UNVERIFIED_CONTAM: hypothetical protein FKN15_024215 [Acipenser sinensis]